MNPDPDAQEQFEELLKNDSSIVVPLSPGGNEQRKLHILTALLNKYKSLVRPPATARRETADYEDKVKRVMLLTKGIRPKPPLHLFLLASLRYFLSFGWTRHK